MIKQDQIEKLEKEKIELEGEVQKLTIKNNWLNLELEKAHSNYLESANELRNRLCEENTRLEGEVQRLMIENEVLNDRIDKAIEYIENMPYLQETDKEYEDMNGNTYFTYKEWDDSELLNILKGDSDE